jgi:hypothetical protein
MNTCGALVLDPTHFGLNERWHTQHSHFELLSVHTGRQAINANTPQ